VLSPVRALALREPEAPLAPRSLLPAPQLARSWALPLPPQQTQIFALRLYCASAYAGKPLDYLCLCGYHVQASQPSQIRRLGKISQEPNADEDEQCRPLAPASCRVPWPPPLPRPLAASRASPVLYSWGTGADGRLL